MRYRCRLKVKPWVEGYVDDCNAWPGKEMAVGQNPVPPVNVLFRRSGTAHLFRRSGTSSGTRSNFIHNFKYIIITKISIGISRQAYPSYIHAATSAYAHK